MKKYQGVSIVTIKGNKGDIGDPFQLKPGQVVSFPGENGSSGKDGESIIGPIGLTGKDGRDGQDAVFEIDAIVKTIIPHIKYADIKDAPQWKPGLVTDKGWAGTGYLREISDVAVSGVSNGQSIQWNSKTNKWENYPPSAGGGTPASPTTSIQFNNAGAFGGSANLKWDGTNLLTANVGLIDTSGTCTGGFTGSKIQSNLGVLDEIDLYFGGLQRMSMTRGYFNICPLLCLGNGLNLCGGPLYFDGINAFAQADISDNVTFIGTSFRTNTSFGIRESGATPTKYTYFQGGDQTIDLTYTLPTGYPASNGYALTSTTSGVLSWGSAGGGSQTPWGSDIDANYYTLNNLGDISFGLNPSTIYGNVDFNYAGQVYFQGINYMSGSFFSCGCWEFTNGNVIFDNGSTVSFNNSDIYMSNLLTSAGYTGQLYTVNIGGINVVAVSP